MICICIAIGLAFLLLIQSAVVTWADDGQFQFRPTDQSGAIQSLDAQVAPAAACHQAQSEADALASKATKNPSYTGEGHDCCRGKEHQLCNDGGDLGRLTPNMIAYSPGGVIRLVSPEEQLRSRLKSRVAARHLAPPTPPPNWL
jgi:hypothetical protein